MSETYDKLYRSNSSYFGAAAETDLVSYINSNEFSSGMLALDIGCGQGRDTIFLAKRGAKVTAIDSSKVGIDQLRERLDTMQITADLKICDIREWNFPEGRFHIGIARTVLDHIPKIDLENVMETLKASVINNGVIFVTVFTTDDPGAKNLNSLSASECAAEVQHYFASRELWSWFEDWATIYYEECYYLDQSHGRDHYHGLAKIVARKR